MELLTLNGALDLRDCVKVLILINIYTPVKNYCHYGFFRDGEILWDWNNLWLKFSKFVKHFLVMSMANAGFIS